jgi:diacylglycerol O-acyltransferase
VDGYSKGQVLLLRLHHVIGDGTSVALICQTLCNGFNTERVKEQLRIEEQKRKEQEVNTTFGKLKQRMDYPVLRQLYLLLSGIVLLFGCVLILLKWFHEFMIKGLDPITLVNSRKGLRGEKAVAFSINEIKVSDAKEIGRPLGATLNDVMLCCLAGAIDKYAVQKGENPQRIDIRVGIPVNIRSKIEEFIIPSNKFGFMTCKLPLGIKDARERLRYIKRDTSWSKQLPESLFTNFVNYICSLLLPLPILKMFVRYVSKHQSVIESNVNTVAEECRIGNSVIKGILPFTPLPWGIGLGMVVISYNGFISVSLTTDKGLLDDPEVVIQFILEEYNSMLKEIAEHPSVAERVSKA